LHSRSIPKVLNFEAQIGFKVVEIRVFGTKERESHDIEPQSKDQSTELAKALFSIQ